MGPELQGGLLGVEGPSNPTAAEKMKCVETVSQYVMEGWAIAADPHTPIGWLAALMAETACVPFVIWPGSPHIRGLKGNRCSPRHRPVGVSARRRTQRISGLRVKYSFETQRVGMRAFVSEAAPRRNSPGGRWRVGCARSSPFPEGADLGKSSSARHMRAKTSGEPEVVSRGTFRMKDKTVQFSEADSGYREVSAGARWSSQMEAGTGLPRGQAGRQLRLQWRL